MHPFLHPSTRERIKRKKKNQNAKERKKRKRIFSRTKTHIVKNEDAKNENEDANSRRTMSI